MEICLRIAGLDVAINYASCRCDLLDFVPSAEPFLVGKPDGEPIIRLSVDDSLRPAAGRKLMRTFDTGNGDTMVYTLPDGGYQFIIKDVMGRSCCLVVADKHFSNCQLALNGNQDMRSFGLNDALMLLFAFASSRRNTLLLHASCLRHKGKAYPFIAKSGTGKSTHTALWMRHIEETDLLNDDNPAIRIVEGKPMVFGTPWSGKTPCYRNVSAPLGAITRIERASSNSIERLGPAKAFASLLPSCSTMKWDHDIYNGICDTLTSLVAQVPVFTLHCLPDEQAAKLCHSALIQ